MRATELMIGDWVYNKNIDKPMQVYPMMLPQMLRHTPVATTEDYNIFPIPLTAEILEKNGLKYEVDYGGYHRSILGSHSKDNKPLICVQWNPQGKISQWEVSNKSGILTGVVAYGYTEIAVNELQHILQTVGLKELAESFKI